jgi:SAM-dependent methyltransferase
VTQELHTPTADSRTSLGHPSYIWTDGLERRLQLLRRYVPLEGKRILDIGCGIGTFVNRLNQFSPQVYGVDIDEPRVTEGAQHLPGLGLAVGEHLPFRDATFDVILLHEVIEHVTNDVETLAEANRVLAPDGRIAIFCPNRLYPFETHGVYLGQRYVFGNIPLVNYLPDGLRNRLVPHARTYSKRRLRRLWRRLPLQPVVFTQVYPGFDHIIARRGTLGRLIKAALYPLENTGLRIFGLSHFVVLKRKSDGSS